MSDERARIATGLNIPIPDPSLLTTDQFNRGQEISRRESLALREFLISEMNRIEKVHEEKFRGLELRFTESKLESKNALNTALKAVTESNDKSEKNFTKQIDALDTQTKTITGALNSQISDLKERITSGEGVRQGATDNTTRIMAAVILIISIVTFGILLVNMTHSSALLTVAPSAAVPVQPM